MKVVFKTNLDQYRSVSWPVLDVVPNIGEFVYVHPGSEAHCKSKKIPYRLRVTEVSYHYDRVEVDLWYTDIDYQRYDQKDLMGQ
jgi:hypothetical protein